jgi:hypothetical protein
MASVTTIREERNERRYFTVLPNMVIDECDPYATRLYSVLKRICGETGAVEITTTELAEKCKMSAGKVSECKSVLVDLGLIEITTGNASARAPHIITIADVWATNVAKYGGKVSHSQGERGKVSHSQGEGHSSPGERSSIRGKTEDKKTSGTGEKKAGGATRHNFDDILAPGMRTMGAPNKGARRNRPPSEWELAAEQAGFNL